MKSSTATAQSARNCFVQIAACLVLCLAPECLVGAGQDVAEIEFLLQALPTIQYNATNLFPEGITYDPVLDAFWVVALGGGGEISIVHRNGTYSQITVAVQNGEIPYPVTAGSVHLNGVTNLLYVTVAEFLPLAERTTVPGVRDNIKTGVVVIDPREPLMPVAYYNFTALPLGSGGTVHFANDLFSGPDGTVYVTDVGQVVALRRTGVDQNASTLAPEVFVSDPLLGGSFGGGEVGANGITFVPSQTGGAGYLLISNAGTRKMQRVDLESRAVTTVDFGDTPFSKAITGVTRLPDGSVALTGRSPVSEITLINSTDNYLTAYVVSVTPVNPELGIGTSTLDGNGTLYVSAGRLNLVYNEEVRPYQNFGILPYLLTSRDAASGSSEEVIPVPCASPEECSNQSSGSPAILLPTELWPLRSLRNMILKLAIMTAAMIGVGLI